MTLRLLNPKGLYDSSPNAYSQVAIVESSRRLAYISGQGGDNPDGSFSPDFATQAASAFRNVGIALDAIGAGVDDRVCRRSAAEYARSAPIITDTGNGLYGYVNLRIVTIDRVSGRACIGRRNVLHDGNDCSIQAPVPRGGSKQGISSRSRHDGIRAGSCESVWTRPGIRGTGIRSSVERQGIQTASKRARIGTGHRRHLIYFDRGAR